MHAAATWQLAGKPPLADKREEAACQAHAQPDRCAARKKAGRLRGGRTLTLPG